MKTTASTPPSPLSFVWAALVRHIEINHDESASCAICHPFWPAADLRIPAKRHVKPTRVQRRASQRRWNGCSLGPREPFEMSPHEISEELESIS